MTTATLRIRYRRQACSASRVHNATALVLLRSFRCQDVAHTFHEGSGPAQVSRTRRFAYLKRISHTLYDNEKHLNAMHVLQVQMSPSSRAHDWLCKILCSPGYTTPDMMAGQSSCRPVYHAQPEHVEHSRAHFSMQTCFAGRGRPRKCSDSHLHVSSSARPCGVPLLQRARHLHIMQHAPCLRDFNKFCGRAATQL